MVVAKAATAEGCAGSAPMISGVLLALHDRKVRRDISAIGVAVAAAACAPFDARSVLRW